MPRLMCEWDFVQIELLFLAWLSNDKNMRQVYIDRKDLHTRTGSGMHGIAEEDCTSEIRDDGKRMNFGQVYGQTEEKCAELWNLPLARVQAYFRGFNATYPNIKPFFQGVEKQIEQGKDIITVWGRRRSHNLTGNWRDDNHTKLELKNYLIQSPAADCTAFHLPRVHAWLDKTGYNKICDPNNIVYDAIWADIECDEKTYEYFINLPPKAKAVLPATLPLMKVMLGVQRIMQDTKALPIRAHGKPFDLPMAVDMKIGISMSKDEMHELKAA